MKKNLLVVLGAAAFFLLLWGGNFAWKNLRGIGPALRQPPRDITKVINTTGMPIKIPPGFSISIFAKGFKAPRVLLEDPHGTILVSLMNEGRIVALPDVDKDGVADKVITVANNLKKPHGLAIDCDVTCHLYIGETDKVTRFNYNPDTFETSEKQKIIDLPGGQGHFTRTLLIIPTNGVKKLLIAVGSSCNVCHETDDRRAKVLVADLDGRNLKPFASGLRNSVFMKINPQTQQVWATEMGRDLLGDDTPPDEINIIEEGKNYGWPICFGKNIHDTDFDPAPFVGREGSRETQPTKGAGFDKSTSIRNPCMEPFETSSFIDIPAHSAPLGLAFIPKEGWPEEYKNDLLVAYHGSWNRTTPTGYKIVRFKLDPLGNLASAIADDFVTGWLETGGALGRPVDLLARPDGTLYISDDKAGVIYLLKVTK